MAKLTSVPAAPQAVDHAHVDFSVVPPVTPTPPSHEVSLPQDATEHMNPLGVAQLPEWLS
jgi:hypothetical protein